MNRALGRLRTLGRCWLVALALLTAAGPAAAQQAGAPRTYPAGWNLVAFPPGTPVPPTLTLYTAQPGDLNYEMIDSTQGTTAGFGYWINLPAAGAGNYSRPIALPGGSSTPYSVTVPAGQWVMVGDPSGVLPASLRGADFAWTYDPVEGLQLATTLQPGQGAFVGSVAGGVVSVTPVPPPAQTISPPAFGSGGPVAAPPSVAAVPVALPPIPLQTNPATAVSPTGNWTWWPQPPLGGTAFSWLPSLPYSGPFLCPSDIVTAFALIYCGALGWAPPP